MTRLVLIGIAAVYAAAMLYVLLNFTGLQRQVFAAACAVMIVLLVIAMIHPDTKGGRDS